MTRPITAILCSLLFVLGACAKPAKDPSALQVEPMTFRAEGATGANVKLEPDGKIVASGKTVAKLDGSRILSADGKRVLVEIDKDGVLGGALGELQRDYRFVGDELVGKDGSKVVVGADGTIDLVGKDGEPKVLGRIEGVKQAKRTAIVLALLWVTPQ
jgi:hypothetical protein